MICFDLVVCYALLGACAGAREDVVRRLVATREIGPGEGLDDKFMPSQCERQ